MEDTAPEIKRFVYRTIMARTEEERLVMCADMFETAKELAKMEMPVGLSESEQRRYVFKRIYGEDWPSAESKPRRQN